MQISFDIFDDEVLLMNTDMKNLKPEEMTLAMFMSNPDWKAVLDVKATGETKGQHHMIQPDGKQYKGGWIGKFRNPEEAKLNFHYKCLYWAVFRGREISEVVLSEYPKLLKTQRRITAFMSNIHIGTGPYIAVTVNSQIRHFHIMDCPLFGRVNMREFVQDHALIELLPDQRAYGTVDDIFGPVEEMAIALERKLKNILPDGHRPHLMLPRLLQWGHKDNQVWIRIPESINDEGECTQYREVEGTTVIAVGSCIPRMECIIDGKPVRMGLYPSILTKYLTNEGLIDWIESLSLNEMQG